MTAINRLTDLGPAVKLMPFSGIQLIELGLDAGADTVKRFARDFWEEPQKSGERDMARLLRVERREDSDAYAVIGQSRTVPEESVYTIRGSDALETFNRAWIPVPVFRIHEQPRSGPTIFMRGPTTWARLLVVRLEQPDERGNTHRLLLALDTSLEPRPESPDPAAYLTPYDTDSDEHKQFRLVDDPGAVAYFANRPWVDDWLDDVFAAWQSQRQRGRGGRQVEDEGRPVCEHWARYLTLIDLIHETVDHPNIVLADTLSAVNTEPPVKVDLVLDIGNSRTCGILIERHADRGHPTLNNSYPLALRDLSRPERLYSEPFESRVEFAKADFGNLQIANRSGRSSAFVWHSMVRTGQEAVDMCISARGGEGSTGLSSPKRYLWDEDAQPQMWRFNMSLHRNAAQGKTAVDVVDSPIMEYLAEDGDVLSALSEARRAQKEPAFSPHFSRASLFTFMLQEVLLHAFVQINSPANRRKRQNTDRPRRLDKIVLTLPPGMPLPERRKFKDRAQAAVKLLWSSFGSFDRTLFSTPMPTVVEPYDEASSTQIVYLYSEQQRLQNGMKDLFGAYGRQRQGFGPGPSLRLASIDIGGGTTDLMVITHEAVANGNVVDANHIVPRQNFRESFRIAGDDMLRVVINEFVLPAIETHARQSGAFDPGVFTGTVFGANNAEMTEPERLRRRQLVVEAIVPVGLAILRSAEDVDGTVRVATRTMRIGEFFAGTRPPSEHVLEYIDNAAAKAGARDFHLLDVAIEIDPLRVADAIAALMDPVLGNLCEVIRDLDCDLVLLSGRPSRLRVMREIVLRHSPVTPDRIVAMSGYRVGNWYPFRNHLGQISDPKTTTAVGAALSWLALGQLGSFRFESSELHHRSTARFIGQMAHGSPKLARVLLHNIDLDGARKPDDEAVVSMAYPLMLGYRQLDLERWQAMPLYALDFRTTEQPRGLPWNVTIRRVEPKAARNEAAQRANDELANEDFLPERVEATQPDNAGRLPTQRDVVMRLQTLPSREGYWLDTGVIKD